jgi:hypothetical protein
MPPISKALRGCTHQRALVRAKLWQKGQSPRIHVLAERSEPRNSSPDRLRSLEFPSIYASGPDV